MNIETQDALGNSEVFLGLQEKISHVAPIQRPVLIVGERGTGKELAAARLHFLSQRWQGPLVAINCAGLAPGLIESELFGHARGAFTGALSDRQGRFESAHRGTLFLDEVGHLPLEVQTKILRVVEYHRFERVGSSEMMEVDVRIVAATNADLKKMTGEGRFLPDLLDRLSFEVIHVPPLRERQEDILLLARHFAGRMALELERTTIPEFSRMAQNSLLEYAWPGNVRELKNVVERAVYQTTRNLIHTVVFDPFEETWKSPIEMPSEALAATAQACPEVFPDLMTGPLKKALENLKFERLKKALYRTHFNQKNAAQHLGLSYHQFRGLYRKFQDRLQREGAG